MSHMTTTLFAANVICWQQTQAYKANWPNELMYFIKGLNGYE